MRGYICWSYLCMCRNLDDHLELNDTHKVSRPLNHWIWDTSSFGHWVREWSLHFQWSLNYWGIDLQAADNCVVSLTFIHACEILPESWLSCKEKTPSLWWWKTTAYPCQTQIQRDLTSLFGCVDGIRRIHLDVFGLVLLRTTHATTVLW